MEPFRRQQESWGAIFAQSWSADSFLIKKVVMLWSGGTSCSAGIPEEVAIACLYSLPSSRDSGFGYSTESNSAAEIGGAILQVARSS